MSPATYKATRSTLDDEPRRLDPIKELKLKGFSFRFLPGDKLIIDASFKNVTEGLEFAQPFTFEAKSINIASSQEPVVSDDDLGGDGVLSPGETTSTLRFEVTHKNQPFLYFVQASAVVREESRGDAPEILSFEVDQSAVVAGPPYEIVHYKGDEPEFATTFTKLKWQVEGEGAIQLTLTATTDGGDVSAIKSKEFIVDDNGTPEDFDDFVAGFTDSVRVDLDDVQVDGDTVILSDFEVGGQPLAEKGGDTPTDIPFTFTLTATSEFGSDSFPLLLECCEPGRALQGN